MAVRRSFLCYFLCLWFQYIPLCVYSWQTPRHIEYRSKSARLRLSPGASPSPLVRSSLYMHGGHSHSHSHQQIKVFPSSPKRRTRALWLFGAVATVTLGLPLVFQRLLQRQHFVAFVGCSFLLWISEYLKQQVQIAIQRVANLTQGLVKHSPKRPSSLWRFLFRNDDAADRVTLLGGLINILLSGGKLWVGLACHSTALVADAGHSLSDLVSDVITLASVNMSRLPPDDDHPQGHAKFEALGSLFLALTLMVTGLGVAGASQKKLLVRQAVEIPTWPALVMAGLSIASKEWLFRITRRVGDRLGSSLVLANAWHHRSDAYSSVLALGAIGLSMYLPSLVWLDALAGLLVAGMIGVTGAEIFGTSIGQLTDAAQQESSSHSHDHSHSHYQDKTHDVHDQNEATAKDIADYYSQQELPWSDKTQRPQVTVQDGVATVVFSREDNSEWKLPANNQVSEFQFYLDLGRKDSLLAPRTEESNTLHP